MSWPGGFADGWVRGTAGLSGTDGARGLCWAMTHGKGDRKRPDHAKARPPGSEVAGVDLPVKAVPGAKRDEVVGWLGERLKVRVSQPPEGGRANEAIRDLVAAALGVRAGNIVILRGASSPEKVLRITGIGWDRVLAVWPRLA